MSYYKNATEAKELYNVFHDSEKCFLCAEKLEGPTIEYLGYLMNGTTLMHRDCAFAMANRIISDCWLNRRDSKLLECDK